MSTNAHFSTSAFKDAFRRLISTQRLAQSWLFFGPSEDKILLARQLANYLERKKWEEPEGILLDAVIMESRNFSGIKLFLARRPVVSSCRTVIINNAQELSVLEQNALLKIVEDPPASALIILLVNDPDSLLPTLASRFQKIYFALPAEALAKAGASDDKMPAIKLAREFLKSAGKKRSEILKNLLNEEAAPEDLDNFVTALMAELVRDKMKNWRVLKELLKRWSLIKRYNVNKKLQLEAAFSDGKSHSANRYNV